MNVCVLALVKGKGVGMMTKTFTYASAFAGIGGMTLGLKPLGGEGVIAWEYDPTEKRTQYAQDAHRLLHPEIPLYGDICEAKPEELPDFDLFCFTPPCQAFSVAGKRGGFEDTRGTLTFEALRIANVKRPKILFMENVKGLVNHNKGNTMGTIIHAINEIGYTVDFTILNSKYFDVAQSRERVYLIAIRDDLVTPEAWVDVKGSTMLPKAKRRYQEEGAKTFNFDWPVQTEVRTRLRDFLEDSVDEKYYLSEDKTAKLVAQLEEKVTESQQGIEYNRKDGVGKTKEIASCLSASDWRGLNRNQTQTAVAEIEGLLIKEATTKGYAVATEGDAVNIQFPNSKTRRGRVGKQMANTIEANGVNQGVVERVGNVNPSGNGMNGNVYSIDGGLSPTLTTNKGEGIKMLERTDRIIEVGKIKPHRNSSLMNTVHDVGGISSTLDTMQGGGREPKILEYSPIMLGHIDLKGHDAIKRVYSPTGQGPTLTTMGGGHREPKIAEEIRPVLTPDRLEKRQNGRRFKEDEEESFTLTSINRHGVAIGEYPRYRIRKLTPRECLRLQAIPEDVIDALLTQFSDSRCYKFAGNGLTTNVISAIGERLIKYL